MRRLYKSGAAALLIAALTLSIAGCGKKESSTASKEEKQLTKITFALDWTPNTNHTGLYVAKEKGYFKDAGLDVNIVQSNDDSTEQIVAAGSAEFGISFQDTLAGCYGGKEKLPITAIATVLQHNTSGIVSRKGEGITSPKGMEGKKYATWDMPIEKAVLKNVMEKDGGDFSKVKMLPLSVEDEASTLRNKTVDAIWIYYGWAGIACEKANLPIDYFAFKDINPVFDYYTPVIIGNNDYIEKNADSTKAFLNAVKKGYEYAIDHTEEAAEILCNAASGLDKDLALKSQEYMNKQYKAEVSDWGYIDPARWNAFYNWLNENNLVENKMPENTGFTNEYLSK